eukprot:COSAG01_NODE_30910_length_607_cov_1.285433_1_plen_41_part_10
MLDEICLCHACSCRNNGAQPAQAAGEDGGEEGGRAGTRRR